MAPINRKQKNIDIALGTRPINQTLDLRFADNVRRNLFPDTFQSYDELLAYLNFLHREGKSKAKIEEAVGIKTGKDFSYAKSGGFSLNTRKMAELVPLGLVDHIKEQEDAGIFPRGTAKKYLDDVHRTWNESSKRTQQIAATTAGYWDNGHWIAAKDPNNLGPTTGRNANPEPQKSFIGAGGIPKQGNAVHQEMPRANIDQAGLDALGIPKNWYEDFYEFVMRDPDLNQSGVNMGSGLGRTMTDAEAMRITSGYANPVQLAAQVDKQTQLAAQGVSLEDVNPNITKAGPVTEVRGPLFPEYSKGKAPKGLMKPLAAAAGLLPGVGAILDVGDVSAGTQQVMGSQSKPQQVVGGLRAASGALGLASLAAPVLAPAALAISGVSALADRRLAADTANKPDVSVSGKPARVIPTRQMPPSKPIGTGQGGVTKPMGAMPSTKPLDIRNEAQYFIVNPIRSAFSKVFGGRDI